MADLTSFGDRLNVAVFGASGGIGGAFTRALGDNASTERIFAFSRTGEGPDNDRTTRQTFDLADEATIEDAAASVRAAVGALDLVIVATGLLHDERGLEPEKTWRSLDAESLMAAYRINTIGPALIGKHFLPLLNRERKSVFAALSARVGSIGDNGFGGWHSYRASKAALNMMIRNFAIELGRRNKAGVCVGLHPGTVDTRLSEPFQRNVPDGKLFTPDFAAGRMLAVLDDLTPEHSGRLFAWDGEAIEP